MSRKNKKNGKVNYSNLHSTNVKVISFDLLEKFSHENDGRYNRNVLTEKVEETIPSIRYKLIPIEKIIDHHHFQGKPVELHYRCYVYLPSPCNYVLQDLSIEQWESIPDLKN